MPNVNQPDNTSSQQQGNQVCSNTKVTIPQVPPEKPVRPKGRILNENFSLDLLKQDTNKSE